MQALELRQLGYFVATAEEHHSGWAARRLQIATPTLSRQLWALEGGAYGSLAHLPETAADVVDGMSERVPAPQARVRAPAAKKQARHGQQDDEQLRQDDRPQGKPRVAANPAQPNGGARSRR